jgi:hypothetical protein
MTNTTSAMAVAGQSRPEPRKFTIFDVMALIAATAVGLALIRYSHIRYFAWEGPAVPGRIVYHTLYTIGHFVYGILPALYALCAAVVASDLRGERLWRGALSRGPGSAACFAALVTALAALVSRVLGYAIGSNPGVLWKDHPADVFHTTAYEAFCSPHAIDSLFMAAGEAAMPAVLAVWLVQHFCELWNLVPEWSDRLGRVLGFILLLWMLTPH